MNHDVSLIAALTRWRRPWGRRWWIGSIAITAMIAAVTFMVFATGGIRYVFSHSMYLPILLAGALFGPVGGALAGLVGGIALGPAMPIDTGTGEMQDLLNWAFRLGSFVIIGSIAGMLFDTVGQLAGRDPVSGAPSQVPLQHDLSVMIDRHTGGDLRSFSLLVLKLENHFDIASTFGPEASTQLLRGVVDRLRSAVRGTSRVYHLHGEFLSVVAPRADRDAMLRSIRDHLHEPIIANGIPVYVGLTIGRADCPEHSQTADALVQHAIAAAELAADVDGAEAVYDVRIGHRNRQNVLLLSGLEEAIAADELCAEYQPKLDLGRGDITGLEALVRWQHPEHGRLAPERFIPQAEKTHLIHGITAWILDAALTDLRRFHERGDVWTMAINLSMRDLQDVALIPTIERACVDHDIAADHLIVEVTESAVLRDPVRASDVLQQLRDRGVGVAIDDFGAGRTSLIYLKQIPATSLKIDRSFVRNVAVDPVDRSVIEAISSLAHRLGMRVVAEGVEDPPTLEAVEELGCDEAQGFLISRPKPAPDLTGFRYAGPGPAPAPGAPVGS